MKKYYIVQVIEPDKNLDIRNKKQKYNFYIEQIKIRTNEFKKGKKEEKGLFFNR